MDRSVDLQTGQWNFRSSGANIPRTFVPWNFRTHGTFAPQTTFMPFNFCSCGTFAAVTLKSCGKQESNVSIDICWQTFAAVYLYRPVRPAVDSASPN